MPIIHRARLGRIRCATIVCADLGAAIRLYEAALEYRVVERGVIAASLANAWNADRSAGARYALLGPAGGSDTYLRFVECTDVPAYRPYSAHGWNAIELVVGDCDTAAAQLAGHGFELVGPPEDLAFSAGALRAAQLKGPSAEILYLTEVRRELPGFVLPRASCPIDRIFIAILTGSSPRAGFDAYARSFDNPSGGPFETPVAVIAGFQGLPGDHVYQVGTLELASGNYVEIDDSPPAVGPRPRRDGHLPAGIAMISVEAANLTATGGEPRAGGRLYGSRAARLLDGAFGEWMELLVD